MGKRNVLVRSTAYAKKVGKKLQEKREIIMLRCALPIGAKREDKKKKKTWDHAGRQRICRNATVDVLYAVQWLYSAVNFRTHTVLFCYCQIF